jgi:aryl-alcohol dehydrogenase-like predicted oxidoreductase
MNFGSRTDPAESERIMARALEAGINFFDTANVYGGGETERILGRFFAADAQRRERVVLATKVSTGRDEWPNSARLSARHIRDACEESLRRLQTDHLDLYQMHHVDRSTPWEEIWQAMDVLVEAGKVLYVGSSNFAASHLVQADETARRRQSFGLVSEQSVYNLTARSVELEVLPACAASGIGVVPYSPLGGGLLGGVLGSRTGGRRVSENMATRVAHLRPQLESWEKLCADIGEEPGTVAIAWLLENPVVTAPIIGPRTIEQLSGVLRALEIDLPRDVLRTLDVLFPGPGGAAPEAYAW